MTTRSGWVGALLGAAVCLAGMAPGVEAATLPITSHLAVWLDANDVDGDGLADSLANGSSVSTWVNKGTLGVGDAVTATEESGDAPLYLTDGGASLGNLPALDFDGDSSGLKIAHHASLNATDGLTVFIVSNYESVGFRFGQKGPLTGTTVSDWFLSPNSGMGVAGKFQSPAYSDGGGAHIFGSVFDPASGTYGGISNLLDGTLRGPELSLVSAYSSPNTEPLYLGRRYNTAGSQGWLDGQIGEILVYNRALSIAARQEVEGYLAWKWGMEDSLPAGHPYEEWPPGASAPDLPHIANVGVTGLADTSADIVGSLVSNGVEVASVTLYWAVTDYTTNATDWATHGGSTNVGPYADGETFTNTVSGLTANTVYYWNHSAVNASGTVWAASSVSPSFKTLGPPSVDNGVGATIIRSTTARLNGTLLDGAPAHVFLSWWADGSGTTNVVDLGSRELGEVFANLTGLTPATAYSYRTWASNDYGTVWAPAASSFATLWAGPHYYVDVDWTGMQTGAADAPFRTLQAAVAAANATGDRDNIRVAAGTYRSTANGGLENFGTQALVISGVGCNIYGGYAGWDGNAANPSFDWTTASRVPRSTIIDLHLAGTRAFNITGMTTHQGNAPLFDGLAICNANHTGDGGAVRHAGEYAVGMRINNCLFTNNVTTGAGGAVYFSTLGIPSSGIWNSEFIGNRAGAGGGGAVHAYFGFNTHYVTNCIFTSNTTTGNGGALFVNLGSNSGELLIVQQSRFTGNAAAQGGAVFNADGEGTWPVRLERCVFAGNSSTSYGAAVGGSTYWHGEYELFNCLLVNNTGSYAVYANGNRVSANQAAVNIRHCTIVNNPNGGVYVRNALGASATVPSLEIRNSIVANNGGTGVNYVQNSGVAARLEYNNVYGHTSNNYAGNAAGGTGSISVDPRFAHVVEGDYGYGLAVGSLSRNTAATNVGIAIDLLGNPRPFNEKDEGFDMGSFEMEPPPKGTLILIR